MYTVHTRPNMRTILSRYTFILNESFSLYTKYNDLGGNSQKFLRKFIRFFATLGLKTLRLFRLKVLFEADIIKR